MRVKTYNSKSITVNLKPELENFIRALSSNQNTSMNGIINKIIEEYYEHHLDKQN